MSPFPQQVFEVVHSIAVLVNDVVRGAWVEGLIVAFALHILFFHTSIVRVRTGGKNAKRSAGANFAAGAAVASPSRKQSRFAAKFGAAPSEKRRVVGDFEDDAKQVQRLITMLMSKSRKTLPDALSLYDDLVLHGQVDLRQHVPDDQHARTMYIALISSSVHTCAGDSEQGQNVSTCTSRYLTEMRSFGFPRNLEFYSTIMKLQVQGQYLSEALLLQTEMVADGISPDENMYVMLLSAAISIGDTKKAFSIFDVLSTLGAVSVRTYMTILRVYARNKDWRGAVQLMEKMEASCTTPDNLVLNNVLGLCVSMGQVDAAAALLPRWKAVVDVVSCNILLKGFAQKAQMKRSEDMLSKMISEGPMPNLISFNTVMDCAVRALQVASSADKPAGSVPQQPQPGHQFTELTRKPWQLLDKMEKMGLEPDRYTCSTLVKGMHWAGCSIVDIDNAVRLLRRVGPVALQACTSAPQSGGASNARLVEVVFNTLLDACVSVRDLDRMEEIFTMMQEFKVGVSAVTCGTLIKAFGQAGRLERCHEVWKDMQERGIKPTIVTFGCYMDACMRSEDLTMASELFEMMREQNVRPNTVVYTSLIRGFAQAKQPAKALQWYRQMREEGIEASCVTFNSILDVVARQLSDPASLEEILDHMREASIDPDVVTYSILLKAFCSSGKIRNALDLFRQMRSKDVTFDQVAFNTLLQACSKADQIEEAEEVFEEMCRQQIMSHVTTSILVKMYGKAHMLDKAIAVSERMEHAYGRKPNLFVYTCLIQACIQNKQVRKSWSIFNRMLRSGVEPDAITYGTVIHGCVYQNCFDHALSVVRHAYMRPQKIRSDASSEVPLVADAMPLKKPVPLQPDVLQVLLTALRRKDQFALTAELEDILAEHPQCNVTSPSGSGGARRKGNRGRRAVSDAVDDDHVITNRESNTA